MRYSLHCAGRDRLSLGFILTGDNADLVLLQDNQPGSQKNAAQVDQRVQGARQELGQAAANAQQAAANAALEGKVNTALATRKGIDAKAIDVEANGGHVVLKGDVASREHADLAVRVAQETV